MMARRGRSEPPSTSQRGEGREDNVTGEQTRREEQRREPEWTTTKEAHPLGESDDSNLTAVNLC